PAGLRQVASGARRRRRIPGRKSDESAGMDGYSGPFQLHAAGCGVTMRKPISEHGPSDRHYRFSAPEADMSNALPAFDKINPDEALQAWEPDARRPWDRKWAGHLYRRAAFGPTLEELRASVRDGLAPTPDRLLTGA